MVTFPGTDARPDMGDGETLTLARYASQFAYQDLAEEAVRMASLCILDWLAVTLAGKDEPVSRIVLEHIRADGGAPQSAMVGLDDRATVEQAALYLGTTSHALDYDDSHSALMGHPSAPVAAAAIAMGDWTNASGRELLQAFIVGIETSCRVGCLMNPYHYQKGWHASSTLGVFGSTAVAANLLRLSPHQTASALGIAGTFSSGLKSVFGTMNKPLQVGRAAEAGVRAARLAARGLTSTLHILDQNGGFVSAYADVTNPDGLFASPPRTLHLFEILSKRHAACHGTHAAIEATSRIMKTHGPGLADIECVVVRVDPVQLGVCDIASPDTGLGMKFSLRSVVALALLGESTADVASYSDQNAVRSDLKALRDRIFVEKADPSSILRAEVTVHLRNGTILQQSYDMDQPVEFEEFRASQIRKFYALATPVLGRHKAEIIAQKCENLVHLESVSSLLQATRPGSPIASAIP